MTIANYPSFSEFSLPQRDVLQGRFRSLPEGISEFTFPGMYLFRDVHQYAVSRLGEEHFVMSGRDTEPFFMLPFGWPEESLLDELFARFGVMKCVSAAQAESLSHMGYRVWEDRDNFDYLYRRGDLAQLSGRKLHKKKNLVNLFLRNNTCVAKPLLEDYTGDALEILERWRAEAEGPGDYAAAREALERMEYLQLCGGIFYVNDEPVAYCLGQELARGTMFVVHFEKAVVREPYKGSYQYVNQAFAAVLPEKYELINREQDVGDPGLRRAKESYQPVGFVEKYKATR